MKSLVLSNSVNTRVRGLKFNQTPGCRVLQGPKPRITSRWRNALPGSFDLGLFKLDLLLFLITAEPGFGTGNTRTPFGKERQSALRQGCGRWTWQDEMDRQDEMERPKLASSHQDGGANNNTIALDISHKSGSMEETVQSPKGQLLTVSRKSTANRPARDRIHDSREREISISRICFGTLLTFQGVDSRVQRFFDLHMRIWRRRCHGS